ncbi:MAG: hypothetical protein FJ302_16825 [Planctomycetes bacterium]|nr:hypothetical protein [Planctomycetota bacterium]
MQDAFLPLYQKLPEFTYDSGQSFRGWLRTALVNP